MPKAPSHLVDVHDKLGFLHRMMTELAADAFISLEGDLSHCRLPKELGASGDETALLKRNTLAPRQDFVVLELTPETLEPIFKQIKAAGLKRAILHVQIERNGVLELGAYDNFHPECVVSGPGIGEQLLEQLKEDGFIRKFSVAAARPAG
jgi:hypothetical protein